MAPPRRHRKRRPARVVGARTSSVAVREPDPEPARPSLMTRLLGPPRSAQPAQPRQPQAPLGPPWTRTDYWVLSGVTALIIVIVGLVISVSNGSITAQVQSSPAPSTKVFNVTKGDGAQFIPNQPITVGGQAATLLYVNGDQLTLESPLRQAPPSGAAVDQHLPAGPVALTISSPIDLARTGQSTTTLTVQDSYNAAFFGPSAKVCIGPYTSPSDNTCNKATVKSTSGATFTLEAALPRAPQQGWVMWITYPEPGSLLTGILQLTVSALSLIVLPVAVIVARPLVARLRGKPRPRVMEAIMFGAVIWIIDTLFFEVLSSTLQVTGIASYMVTLVVALLSGFALVPLVYPLLSRMLQPRPRPGQPLGRGGGGGR